MVLPKIYIASGKEKVLDNRHSWIFSGAVKVKTAMKEGDIVEIRRSDGSLAAYAFFTDGPSIVAKIFEHTDKEIDVFSKEYWKNKIFNAYKVREQVRKVTTGYRLFYAEGDFLPGLIIDAYNNIAVIQTYNKGIDQIFAYIVEALQELGFEHIFLKKKYEKSDLQLGWQTKPFEDELIIEEYGIKFIVDIEQGQKTGFYVDQRENRKLLERYATGRKVLNLFSYTGGFSLYALRANAELVDSVDISQRALDIAVKNIELNNFDSSKHRTFARDCFDYLNNVKPNQYDLIIIDPPAFAKSNATVKNAIRGYRELNIKAFRKIAPGGIVFTFSCSQRIEPQLFRNIIFTAAAEAKRNIRILHQLHQGPDHPINIFHPETEYLKGLVLYVE